MTEAREVQGTVGPGEDDLIMDYSWTSALSLCCVPVPENFVGWGPTVFRTLK